MPERLGLWLERIRCAVCEIVEHIVRTFVMPAHPGRQPTPDVPSAGDGGEIVDFRHDTFAGEYLQDPEIDSCAADGAARETERGRVEVAALFEYAVHLAIRHHVLGEGDVEQIDVDAAN